MTKNDPFACFSPEDLAALRRAVELLESPGLFIRVANWLGTPLELGLQKLPVAVLDAIQAATTAALEKALDVALWSLDPDSGEASSDWWHKLAVMATGAAGGVFGLPGMALELPVSTGIMLRSIADVARSEGEDLRQVGARLFCLSVFALGGPSDGSESSYLVIRGLLAREVARVAEFLAEREFVKGEAPVLLRLMTTVAERFGLAVEEKTAAEALPVVGAIGGAAINALFMDHFQDMARGHFICRRLDRSYGEERVSQAYRRVMAERTA